MELKLIRKELGRHGVFSDFYNAYGRLLFYTLERSYLFDDGSGYKPKIPNGTFQCVRGLHRLHGMSKDFETFEITGVVGHNNLLFHYGNYNDDSEGCILLGKYRSETMINDSRDAFKEFMKSLVDINLFNLIVETD